MVPRRHYKSIMYQLQESYYENESLDENMQLIEFDKIWSTKARRILGVK